ncbi:DUF4350 domain-containing protein [Tellurirhabdus bombi]|uniref:DUF4350 domain-containing protein n=1 Tax=Tellurirhabdus bombi TaxID=2907205 RepID=UPI001F38BDBD|nr:DUF4350 domain-containing protein [Tellurirhabdus bombi]
MKINRYLLILLLTVVAYGLFEYYRPKPIDWRATYVNKDKIPFGTRVLYELLPEFLNDQPVEVSRLPVFNQLTETKLPARSNYFFVCERIKLSTFDQTKLLQYVAKGNNTFLSAYYFPDSLAKTLGFKADLRAPSLRDTTLGVNFVNPSLRRKSPYHFRYDDGRNFLEPTSNRVTVLARNARNEPVFLKIPYGKGVFYIHNLPLAFTNYYLLDPNSEDFASKSLAYLPKWPTYWDEYQKRGRFDENEQTPLRYVLSQEPLRWAYYLTLASLLLYAIFAGKRTQRIIPIVEKPKNTSLEFVQTVGGLYFQRGDHTNLAQKKVQYFFAFLREHYLLNPSYPDEEFKETLSQKSGVSPADIRDLFRVIAFAQQQTTVSEHDLLVLNEKIEAFYNLTKN